MRTCDVGAVLRVCTVWDRVPDESVTELQMSAGGSGEGVAKAIRLGVWTGLRELLLELNGFTGVGDDVMRIMAPCGPQVTKYIRIAHDVNLRGDPDCLTDVGLSAFLYRNPTAITGLDISFSKVTDTGLEVLTGMTALRELRLNYCTTLLGEGLTAMSPLTALAALALSGTIVQPRHLPALHPISTLTSLTLAECPYMGEGFVRALQHLNSTY
jgi:hypothetical protein